jgi:acetyl esterase/lipase
MIGSCRLPCANAWNCTPRLLAIAVLATLTAGCRVTDMTLWQPAEPMPPDACQVEVVKDVAYYSGPGADDLRHRLDLFLPKGKTNCPVVLLVHGGAWVLGDNRCCGLYSSVGQFLASRGVAAVLPNYRLSPGSKHPEHIHDVARAFAWTRNHIAEFGGRPDQIILAGHSAGGHLVALLATDEKYLNAEGQRVADIKGVVAISGVYRIPTENLALTLGGASSRSASLDEMAPLRGAGGWSWTRRLGLPGIPMSVDVFGLAFGDDPETRQDASPVNHVRPGLPPFLILSAENDLPMLPGMAQEFHWALLDQGCEARLFTVRDRNHNSIMIRAIEPQDPVAHAMLEFIREHAPCGPNQ